MVQHKKKTDSLNSSLIINNSLVNTYVEVPDTTFPVIFFTKNRWGLL